MASRTVVSTPALAGTLGAVVLAGCPLYVLLMQVNTLDMGLAFFLSAAVFARGMTSFGKATPVSLSRAYALASAA